MRYDEGAGRERVRVDLERPTRGGQVALRGPGVDDHGVEAVHRLGDHGLLTTGGAVVRGGRCAALRRRAERRHVVTVPGQHPGHGVGIRRVGSLELTHDHLAVVREPFLVAQRHGVGAVDVDLSRTGVDDQRRTEPEAQEHGGREDQREESTSGHAVPTGTPCRRSP